MKLQHCAPRPQVEVMRHARHKVLGMTVEEIAKQDRVGIRAVEESIRNVELYNSLNSLEALELGETEVILFNKEVEKVVLADALKAEKKVYAEGGENAGEVIASEPDYDTRLKAVDSITKKAQAIFARHAKGNSINTNVSVGVGITENNGMSFEDRLREVYKRRQDAQNSLPVQNGELPAGEVIDLVPEKVKAPVDGNTQA